MFLMLIELDKHSTLNKQHSTFKESQCTLFGCVGQKRFTDHISDETTTHSTFLRIYCLDAILSYRTRIVHVISGQPGQRAFHPGNVVGIYAWNQDGFFHGRIFFLAPRIVVLSRIFSGWQKAVAYLAWLYHACIYL